MTEEEGNIYIYNISGLSNFKIHLKDKIVKRTLFFELEFLMLMHNMDTRMLV